MIYKLGHIEQDRQEINKRRSEYYEIGLLCQCINVLQWQKNYNHTIFRMNKIWKIILGWSKNNADFQIITFKSILEFGLSADNISKFLLENVLRDLITCAVICGKAFNLIIE